MAKFHINPSTGNPGECSATVKDCPFGSADEHFGSPEEARAAYEAMMSSQPVLPSKRTRVLDKDTYVSVFTATKDLLTEDYPKELASSLEPGEYAALYHDSKSSTDRYIKITVSGGDEVEFERISGFKKISSPSTARTQAAVSNVFSEIERLEAVSNPSYCKQNSVDRITLLEGSQATRRILAKFDWQTAEGAFQGRRELEDLEWVLDHDLDLAEREGKQEEMNALKENKRIVGDLVTELNKRGS